MNAKQRAWEAEDSQGAHEPMLKEAAENNF